MEDIESFLKKVDHAGMPTLDRALAILWWAGREDHNAGLQAGEICKVIEKSGHPKQNITRCNDQLKRDKRVSRVPGRKEWRLHPNGRKELDDFYKKLINVVDVDDSPSIIPDKLLLGINKKYIFSLTKQVNVSYNIGNFDCCAVMVRRLMESLIIEVYIRNKKVSDIRSGGSFLMLDSLIKKMINDKDIILSRDMPKSMSDIKRIGDTAAHDRIYITTEMDINEEKLVIRKVINELLVLSGLKNSNMFFNKEDPA